MKKKRLLIAGALVTSMLLGVPHVSAQQDTAGLLKNKKGYVILPQAGDIALGFNAVPVMDLVFQTLSRNFNGTTGNLVGYTSNTNYQITGKYFLDAKTAIRARFGINTLSSSETNRVQDAEAWHKATLGTADDRNAASLIRVEDHRKYSSSSILLNVGIEKRRGHARLQGVYGAELGIGNSNEKETITYGNQFSDQYNVEYTTNFTSFATALQTPTPNGRVTRTLDRRITGGFSVGLRAFVGVEYFFCPKISIAAEYGWGYAIRTQRRELLTREVYNNGENGPAVLIEDVDINPNRNTNGFSVDNNNGIIGSQTLGGGSGAITLLFHF